MIEIKVLGPGCTNCIKLEALCREVIAELGVEANIDKVTNVNRFSDFGVWLSPGLIVNGEVKVQGKLPTKATLMGWIKSANV
jgi:small redox-active disulfide protein 2